MAKFLRSAVAGLVMSLLAAACGSAGGDNGAADASTSSAVSPVSTTVAPPAASEAGTTASPATSVVSSTAPVSTTIAVRPSTTRSSSTPTTSRSGALELIEGPDGDAFYTPPSPLPPGQPGDLIWTQKIDNGPAGARSYRILYHSRTVDGADIAVSGTMVIPDGAAPAGGWTVVAYAHATVGVADKCAPSRTGVTVPSVAEVVKAGYVAVATDYQGLGTPGPHPYLVGPSEGRNVLDAARTAQVVPGANKQVLIWGHSQGGQAAVWAGELASTYAPDLKVLGIVAAAPPARVGPVLPLLAAIPVLQGFFVIGTYGLKAAYPELDLAQVLTPEIMAELPRLEQDCVTSLVLAFAGSGIKALAKNPTDVPAFAARIAAGEAGQTRIPFPVLVEQGDTDILVPQSLTRQYVTVACGNGTPLAYKVYPGVDHSGVMNAAAADTFAFFAARTAGTPFTSTC
ncbi:MAG: alpha/beta fold hydrolase [Acidimicrobiia bacterium]